MASRVPVFESQEFPTLEELFTGVEWFGLVDATPAQRAACRVLEGRPIGDLWKYKNVREAFRGVKPPELAPFEFVLLAGIRAAKSLLAATVAFRAAMTVDLSKLLPGETARIPIVSVDKDKARIIFNHLVGTMLAKDRLRPFLADEPTDGLVKIARPDGFIVEILVTAGRRAGASLVGRWLAGCYFDEAARMLGSDEAVVNLEDSRRAVIGRMLPGAQLLYPSSPFAPEGPIYRWTEEFWGKPTADLVVMRAPGKAMNPSYWTDERLADLKRRDPITYRTDGLAEFADSEYSVFTAEDLDACMRPAEGAVEPKSLHFYVATMDPATRSNAWTLTVWTCTEGAPKPRYSVVLAKQWVPRGERLSPITVLTEISDEIIPYGIDTVYTDQWSVDAMADLAATIPPTPDGAPRSLMLVDENTTVSNRYEGIKTLQLLVEERRLEIPRDHTVKQDLIRVKRRVTTDGIKFVLPRSSDGRHADYVPALALATFFLPPAPAPPPRAVDDPMLQRELARIAARQSMDLVERSVMGLSGVRR